jgi:arginine deiminase
MMTQVKQAEKNHQALINLFEDKGLKVEFTDMHDDVKEWAVMEVKEGRTMKRGIFLFQDGHMVKGKELKNNK